MTNQNICGTCIYFDAIHEICTYQTSRTLQGKALDKRRATSPACWEGYLRQPEPGEMMHLFQKNRIQHDGAILSHEDVDLFPLN